MWHCECEQSIHVQQPRGLDLGRKIVALALAKTWGAKAKAKTWGAKAKAKTLSSKAKAKTFMRCPWGSSRPRPGPEDNKTDRKY